MCNYIVKNRISSVSQIKEFNRNGLKRFSKEDSTETRLVFTR